MTLPPKQPSWRKPAGMLTILLIILIWSVIVVSASEFIGTQHIAVQTIIVESVEQLFVINDEISLL